MASGMEFLCLMPNMKDLSLRLKEVMANLKVFDGQTMITIRHPPSSGALDMKALSLTIKQFSPIFLLPA